VPATTTPFERLGGKQVAIPLLRSAVDRLYFWITRDDELFNAYFRGVDMPGLKAHMVTLLASTLGDPDSQYTGRELALVHARLHITPTHYDRVCDYVEASLLVEHCPRDILATVAGVLADLRPVIAPMR
jgi:hemoglobin